MTDRTAFEAHFKLTQRQQAQHKDGSYCDPITQARWEGWQVNEQDAARYRWIKEHAKRDGRDGGWWGYYVLPMLPGWDGTPYAADRGEGYDHKTLDEAVDAAMLKGK